MRERIFEGNEGEFLVIPGSSQSAMKRRLRRSPKYRCLYLEILGWESASWSDFLGTYGDRDLGDDIYCICVTYLGCVGGTEAWREIFKSEERG